MGAHVSAACSCGDDLYRYLCAGLNETLVQLLPFFPATFLVPTDLAFQSMSAPDLALMGAKKDGLLQLMAFHVWFPAFTGTELKKALPGTTVCPTLALFQ